MRQTGDGTAPGLRRFGGWGLGLRRPPPALIWMPAVLVAAALALPLAYLVLRTLGAGSEALELLLRPRTFEVLLRTVLLALTVALASAALALPLAWLTVRTDLPGRRFWTVVTAIPLVIPSYVAGFVLVAAMGPRGMLQQLLAGPFGIERLPEIYGFPGAALALTLVSYPYLLLSVRAALWRLDPALEEAARSLGHSQGSTFLRITLPQLQPALAAGSLLVILYVLSDFGAVSLLQFRSFTWEIFVQYQASFDRTLAAVLSLVLVALTVLILALEGRARGRARYYRSTAGAARPPLVVPLGPWRWPAAAFCGLVTLMALGLPAAVLGFWLVRGLASGGAVGVLWGAAGNSLAVSAMAAAIAMVASLPVAVLAVRYPSWFSRLVERATYLGFALPGIVIAMALVFLGANFFTPIYQTLALLVFAYVVLFLPQAQGATRSSLLQISPRLEEAARSLGRSPWSVLLAVTIPLLRPGLLAGAALVFLTAMKELPATLLLSPIGFKTLATSIWAAAEEGFFAQAAVPALLLILVAAVPMAFISFREQGRE